MFTSQRTRLKLLSGVVLFLALSPSISLSSEPFAHVGTYAAQFLTLPVGTRNVGMAGTGTADDLDPINVVYNPANLALLEGFAVSGGHVDWPADVNLYDFGVFGGTAYPLHNGYTLHLGAAMRYSALDLDVPDNRVIFLPDGTGRDLDGQDWSIPLTLAGGVSNGDLDASIGATVKFATLGLSNQSKGFTAFDVGLRLGACLYSTDPITFKITGGASASNLGGDIDYGTRSSQLPREHRGGIGIQFAYFHPDFSPSTPLLTANGNADYLDTTDDDGMLFGGEIGFVDIAFLRLGHIGEPFATSGTSFGFGLQLKITSVKIRADYAHLPFPSFFNEDIDVFGLTVLVDI
ncbi:MAG: hypothetical protein JSW58_06595 [Candidatus Latescibacterota bacterium]|nr:MAG: hypothetical protein JSW58_06595 [Candidatus Latescibacterota bacterium]